MWIRIAVALVSLELAFIVVSTIRDGRHVVATPAPSALASAKPLPAIVRPHARSRITVADSTAFRFRGPWEHIAGHRDGRMAGKSSRAFKRGARATLWFRGRFVRIYGVVGPGGGFGAVKLDARRTQLVDFFATAKAAHRIVYESGSLAPGKHRLSLTVVPDPSIPGARSQYVNIEGAEYGS